MSAPIEFPLSRPVLSQEQATSILQAAPSWRAAMATDNHAPLYYETSKLLRGVGFPAVLELILRAVQAEVDRDVIGVRTIDWLVACNEMEGASAADAIYQRACEIAGVPLDAVCVPIARAAIISPEIVRELLANLSPGLPLNARARDAVKQLKAILGGA